MNGCEYVLSVASPVFFYIPKDENEVIRPAVEGMAHLYTFQVRANLQLAFVLRLSAQNWGATLP